MNANKGVLSGKGEVRGPDGTLKATFELSAEIQDESQAEAVKRLIKPEEVEVETNGD